MLIHPAGFDPVTANLFDIYDTPLNFVYPALEQLKLDGWLDDRRPSRTVRETSGLSQSSNFAALPTEIP